MLLEDALQQTISTLEAKGLRRHLLELVPENGGRTQLSGHNYINFSSNDYLGFSRHKALVEALMEGAQLFGVGAGASRLVTGTTVAHQAAEAALAEFVALPAARLFSTGYATNVGVLQALFGPDDLILSDALNHASLIDGCRLSKASVKPFRHVDVAHVEALLREHRAQHRLAVVVTESVFSMDGDLAPLVALRRACDAFGAALMVDEAHSLGMMGQEGRGACGMFHVKPDILVGMLGKAFGLSGGFVAGSETLVAVIENRARSFVYTTAPSPALAHVVPRSVALVKAADEPREQVMGYAKSLKRLIGNLGFATSQDDTPIVPLILGQVQRTLEVSSQLRDRGFLVQAIRPPTVADGFSRLRIVPTANHQQADITALMGAIEESVCNG